MRTQIIVIFLASFACASLWDVVQTSTITDATCFGGRTAFFLRALRSNGQLEPNLLEHTFIIAKERGRVGYYATPCIACSAIEQANKICNLFKVSHDMYYATVFIDVTDPKVWNMTQKNNIAFLNEFAEALDSCGIKDCPLLPSILTTKESWETIMGPDYHDHAYKDLWYVHLDGNPDARDFVPFGGWTKPLYKSHTTQNDRCGNVDVKTGVLIV